MSLSHSPNTVTNGLIFNYDTSNIRSFKGQPTTNLVTNADTMTGFNNYGSGPTSTFVTEFGTTGWRMNSAGSWNGTYKGVTIPTPGTYTFSAWYRYWGGSVNNNGATCYVSGWGGGDSATTIDKNKIGQWQRISNTLNVTTASCTFFLISFGGTNGADNSTWDVTMPQVESGSYATTFVNGTRSKTQALLDLTGSKTIDLTNTNASTFNSDFSALTLDGNNQYIYANGGNFWNAWSPNGVNGNSSMTIEVIFNSTDTGGLIISRPWNGGGQYNYRMDATSFSLYVVSSSTGVGYSNICTGSTVHMVYWMNATQYGVYRNGQTYVSATNHGLSGSGGSSGTNDFGTLFGSLYPYGEGWSGNTGFSLNGKYYHAKIYNRALTADEVRINYNALRGRFNI